ncbi:hypothetical protein B0T20DRAFT_106358 [Sordaria brevicollis]|uniref:Extracellular membrane protein CFEM domain-containing protein n=1 Tax=Sordaria brevicollis TaxID=83679 RepID=A0AAE0NUW2_SORBR|nr:hypothetical protein B0T20DRAFT_106358 [Sordaria brevicollis]
MKQVLPVLLVFAALSLAEHGIITSTTGHTHSGPRCTTTVFTTVTPKPSTLTAYTTSTLTTTITTSLPVTANSTSPDLSTAKQLPRANSRTTPSRHTSKATGIPYPITNSTASSSTNTGHSHPTFSSCYTRTIQTTLPASTVTTTSTLTVTATSITIPTPSSSPCTPGVCGTFTFTPCPNAPLGDCLCGFDVQGQPFCSLDDWCQNEIGCDTNEECLTPEGGWQTGEGFRCLVGSCCDFEVPDDGQGGGSVVKKKGKCVKERGVVCVNVNVEVECLDRGVGGWGKWWIGWLKEGE